MNVDSENMIEVLKKYPEMMEKAISFGDDVSFPKELIDNIIVLGMGGSGYTGDLLKCYLHDLPMQIHVIKDYTLPKFASKKSLVFAISYSGNTEEPIAAYRSAVRRGIRVVSITSGGKLEELSKMNKTPIILIPKGIQPRLSTPYLFISVLNVLNYSGIIEDQESIIKRCAKNLKASASRIESNAKDLSVKLMGHVPIIYSSSTLFCLSEKWKTDINENAKIHAFYNVFPEFNHNELCGYENLNGKYYVVILSDTDDHERVKKRIEIFKKLAKKYKTELSEIAFTGNDLLTRLFSAVWMGLYVAYFMAIDSEIDPSPVEIIENLKKNLVK